MKYCIFSDVHGNLINLESLFDSCSKLSIDKFICLGDLCNYYSDNIQVIELLQSYNVLCLLGNHDQMYINDDLVPQDKMRAYNYDYKLKRSNKHIEILKKMPLKIEISGSNNILMCHGSPFDFTKHYVYPTDDLSFLNLFDYNLIFIGHTHRQFLRKYNNITCCNVGSIGMPRDDGSLMSFVIYDTESGEISLMRKKINKDLVLSRYLNFVPIEVIDLLNRREQILYQYTLINE